MGKVKSEIYCYLTADILTKVLQKCSLSSPLPSIWILSKPLNWIGCHGNQKDTFVKKYSKIISDAIRGMKLQLCRNVHNISLYKNFVLYCRCSCAFVAMATKFPLTYNEKSESRSLLHCRYFDSIFIYLFIFYKYLLLSSPPPSIKKLYIFLISICCHGNWKSKMMY